jgi:large subunit ribosomal protein L22
MEATAKLNNTKGSARKARLVADLVRGKEVYYALNMLTQTRRGVAPRIEKLIESAVKNWEVRNEGFRAEDSDLFIKEIRVDVGRTLKRFRPAPHGRAFRIRKRTSHISVVIDSRVPIEAEAVQPPEPEEVETETVSEEQE